MRTTNDRPLDTTGSLRVRDLVLSDLSEVARIHTRCFPGRGLTLLGSGVVRRYYRWQLEGPHQVDALAAHLDRQLVGYCFGGKFRGALRGFLRANRLALVLAALARPWLLLSPVVWNRARRATSSLWRRQPSQKAGSPAERTFEESYGILAIAVDPRHRQRRIGRQLMEVCEARARAAGFMAMHLTVDPSNEAAAAFYERLGWRRDLGESGAWRGVMIKRGLESEAALE